MDEDNVARRRADEALRLASRAHEMAQKAHNEHTAHERMCSLRWQMNADAILEIKKNINHLFSRWWGMAIGTLLTVLGVIATIAYLAYWLGQKLAKLP